MHKRSEKKKKKLKLKFLSFTMWNAGLKFDIINTYHDG